MLQHPPWKVVHSLTRKPLSFELNNGFRIYTTKTQKYGKKIVDCRAYKSLTKATIDYETDLVPGCFLYHTGNSWS